MKALKATILGILISGFLVLSALPAQAVVSVKGYYRKDGTYVAPHYRSNPDGNPYNNWSYPGNVNPYTGKVAPGNPDTYLKNYYGSSNYRAPSVPNYTAPSYDTYIAPTYSAPSTARNPYSPYVRGVSESSCASGFYIDGQNCNPLPLNTHAKAGGLSGWECNTGYVLNGSSCVVNSTNETYYSCPVNSYKSGDSCYCESGFTLNSQKTGCEKPKVNQAALDEQKRISELMNQILLLQAQLKALQASKAR